MFKSTLLVLAAIAITPMSLAYAQGRSGRNAGAGNPNGTQAANQQRIQAQANQRAAQQAQRRITDGASRAVQRRTVAAQRAAQAASRRSARDVASGKADIRPFANTRGVRPETVAAKAAEHADIHAVISAGLVTGQPLHFNESQRGLVADVFGDANLLERPKRNRSKANVAQTDFVEKKSNNNQDGPAPGARANVRSRLANAIRVRRSQISELRDNAIDSGDAKLLERADHLEKTLDIFLQNQARVESNLAEAGIRSSDSVTAEAPRTADASTANGLLDESTTELDPRVE